MVDGMVDGWIMVMVMVIVIVIGYWWRWPDGAICWRLAS
jgi:hypothetical protein